MSERDRKAYLANRVFQEGETSLGLPIRVADRTLVGCMWVFWTKKAAREMYGRNVELTELFIPKDSDHE